jgi:hypothetical protein
MSHRVRSRAPAKTPIERIFERVMGRSMTSQERVYLDLESKKLKVLRVSASKQSRAA